MSKQGSVVVVGGTGALGSAIARHFANEGREVVISGRDARRAAAVASEIGGHTRGIALDLARPAEIAGALADVGAVDHLILAAIDRADNRVRDYDITQATRLVTVKLVGHMEVVHALASRLGSESSILLFGGEVKDKPYLGSTVLSTVNAAMSGLVRSLVMELAPVRVNAIHPGIVGDSPFWSAKPAPVLEGHRSHTPTGRLVRTQDVVDAGLFLLTNPSANGIDLVLDGGWHFMTW